MDNIDKFNNQLRIMAGQMNGLLKTLPAQIGALALESIDDNFRSQSFFGAPWKARADGTGGAGSGAKRGASGRFESGSGRALLVLTGRLRRSFKLQNSGLSVTIFTDVPYAEIHNEGGTITGTANVGEYTRHQYEMNEVSKPGSKQEEWRKEKVGSGKVRAHSREMNLTIPQRQFMGEHPELDNRFISLLEQELGSIFDG